MKKALVFDPHCPCPPQTGTHRSELAVLGALRDLGYAPHVFGSTLATDLPWTGAGIGHLEQALGARVHLYRHDWLDALYLQRGGIARPGSWDRYNPPWFRDAFRRLFEQLAPELVVVHYAWWGRLAQDEAFRSATRLIVSHDSLTLNERMQAALAPYLDHPLDPRRIDPAALAEDFFVGLEQGLGDDGCEEYRIYDCYDGTIAFSDFDAAMIERHTRRTAVCKIPITHPVVPLANSHRGAALLVMSNYSLNLQGYAYFAARVLPRVLRECPDFVLEVAGGGCAKVRPVPGVRLLGPVPDLAPLYAASRFAICPVIGGTGMQVKIVEAMAHGVPVIALRRIAASSPIEHGVNGLIAADAAEFARHVVALQRDPERCRRLGEAARETIRQHYSPEVQAAQWARAIASAEARRLPEPAPAETAPVAAMARGAAAAGPEPAEAPPPRGPSGGTPHIDPSAGRDVSAGSPSVAGPPGRPRISIITPALNCAAYLRQCIESVAGQGYDNFEHIVVDGGSADGTVAILRDHPHVRWVSEPDRGEAHALNKGLAMATGDIIGWLNADDFYAPGALAAAAGALDPQAGVHLVYGKVLLLGEGDRPVGVRVPDPAIDLRRLLRWHRPLHLFQPAMFFTRRLMDEVGAFREDLAYAVDLDYWVRTARRGFTFHYLDRVLARMRLLREDGKSATAYAEKDADWLRACLPALADLDPAARTYFWKDYYIHRLANPRLYGDGGLPAPDGREAALGLALAINDTGGWAEGLGYLAKAAGLYPDCPDLHALLGEALNHVGRPGQADAAFAAADRPYAAGGRSAVLPRRPASADAPRAVPSPDPGAPPLGFNVIGYVSGALGIGVTARSVARALVEAGHPVAVLDVDPGGGRARHDLSLERYTVDDVGALVHPINLFVFPPADLAAFLAAHPEILQPGRRLNACWCVWELPVLPRGWSEALKSMDVLIAQSDFIHHALAFGLPAGRILSARHPLYLPPGIAPERRRYGLPEGAVVFVTALDAGSDLQRKNPCAVLDAFEQALGGAADAHLVIKLSGAGEGPPPPLLEQLAARCAAHPRVHLLTQRLDYREVLGLYAGGDVFVSLHRAEGLGLGLMEAMALGRPVIATAWSGNMSFMDRTNACLVDYRLVPVAGSIQAYSPERVGPGARWAEPDTAAAAAWMRRLYEDPALRREIGARAARAMAAYREAAARLDFVEELRAIMAQIATQPVPVPRHPSAADEAAEGPVPAAPPAAPASSRAEAAYQGWLAQRQRARQRPAAADAGDGEEGGTATAFHLLVVLHPGQEARLADTLDGLAAQTHPAWGLTVIAATPCPDPAFEEMAMFEWIQARDDPLAAANRAVQETKADWVVLLDAGDRLEPQALSACADQARRHPEWRLVYTDEDRTGPDGAPSRPLFKPDCNQELLRSMDYLGGFCPVRRDALVEAGGYQAPEVVSRYDLALRILERFGEAAIGHIADVLNHRHAEAEQADDEAWEAGRCAVERHLARAGTRAAVRRGLLSGTHLVEYRHEERPRVSVLIPTRDRRELLEPCVEGLLARTAYPDFEVIIVDNRSRDPATLDYLAALPGRDPRVRVLRYDRPYNFAAINNLAAGAATGEYLLLLNNDTLIVQDNWLDRMMDLARRPDVGIVGARLVHPDRTLQHAGIVLGMGANGVAEHPFMGRPMDEPGYLNRAQVAQEVAAVTGACLLVRKTVWEEAGGMDARRLKVMYNDVDLCLKVRERGHRVVWTPFATVVHHGSASLHQDRPLQGKAHQRACREVDTMLERWLPRLARDPCYNPNLSLIARDASADAEVRAHWDEVRDRPRIMAMSAGSPGSREHRLRIPLTALERDGRAAVHLLPRYPDRVRVPSVAELAREAPGVLLAHNAVHDVQIEALERYRRFNRDTLLVFGQDDLMTELPRSNPFRERVYPDMRRRLRRAMRACHRLLVTTEPLAQACRGMAEDIVILPNYLDGRVWRPLAGRRRRGRRPRVGWAGAPQHAGDLAVIRDVVKATAGEVEWVFFGQCLQELLPHVAEVHDPVAFMDYPARLAGLDLDIAVAPLAHNRFNECKSNLKILEYGALGIPVVCTDIHPYRDAPVARVRNTTAAWVEAIRARAHDLDAAAQEGERLRRWVYGQWMLEDHLEDWLDALAVTPSRALARAAGGPGR